MAKYKTVRIGFENENPAGNIVCISKKEREKLEVDIGSPVKVKTATQSQIAIVQLQFKEFTGVRNVCSVNTKLAERLHIALNDTVEISKEVTETEYAQYEQMVVSEAQGRIAEQMANLMRRAAQSEL